MGRQVSDADFGRKRVDADPLEAEVGDAAPEGGGRNRVVAECVLVLRDKGPVLDRVTGTGVEVDVAAVEAHKGLGRGAGDEDEETDGRHGWSPGSVTERAQGR